MAADLDANIWGVVAASGTGKGLWMKQQLRRIKPQRLAVWDFKKEYEEFAGKRPAPTLADLRSMLLDAGDSGPLRVRYVPRNVGDEKKLRKEFERFCSLVQAWQKCMLIAEELAMVTTPGWAPGAWREMTTSGRHDEVHIIGSTQNPAMVDKTFLGNCTLLHVGPLRNHRHRLAAAQTMDIEVERLAALVKFQWIEKNFDTGQITEGWTYPPGYKKPAKAAAAASA